MLLEKRNKHRYPSLAKAKVIGVDCGETLLKDLSIIGCCLASAGDGEVKPGNHYKIEIIPEEAAEIGKFDIIAELKRSKHEDNTIELGFAILESPKGKQFQRYVDYLAWRSEAGLSSGESLL